MRTAVKRGRLAVWRVAWKLLWERDVNKQLMLMWKLAWVELRDLEDHRVP